MSNERDTDQHGMTMLEKAFAVAVVLAALLAFGSCMAGGGG